MELWKQRYLRKAQLREVQAVAMEMSAVYEASMRMTLSATVVVFDKFHEVKMLQCLFHFI